MFVRDESPTFAAQNRLQFGAFALQARPEHKVQGRITMLLVPSTWLDCANL